MKLTYYENDIINMESKEVCFWALNSGGHFNLFGDFCVIHQKGSVAPSTPPPSTFCSCEVWIKKLCSERKKNLAQLNKDSTPAHAEFMRGRRTRR